MTVIAEVPQGSVLGLKLKLNLSAGMKDKAFANDLAILVRKNDKNDTVEEWMHDQ